LLRGKRRILRCEGDAGGTPAPQENCQQSVLGNRITPSSSWAE
jgi:hypothetical protein